MIGDLVASPGWAGVLDRVPHDVFHLPAYVEVDAHRLGGVPRAFVAEDRGRVLLVPLVMRHVPASGWVDAVSPYGYGGPVSSTEDSGFLREAFAAFRSVLEDNGVVTCLLRLHPLLGAVGPDLDPFGTVVTHGATVSLDLTAPETDIECGMRENHRRDLRRAYRQGVTTRVDDWSLNPAFLDMYDETMARVGATDDYRFEPDYVLRLRERLGDAVHLITVLNAAGPSAAGVFFEHQGIASYYLGASRTAALAEAPSKVMIDVAWRFARARGNRVLHLGGGLHGTADDSLFRFKAGFSDLRHPYQTVRAVIDATEYARLCGLAPHRTEPEGYFPAYRRAGAAVSAGVSSAL